MDSRGNDLLGDPPPVPEPASTTDDDENRNGTMGETDTPPNAFSKEEDGINEETRIKTSIVYNRLKLGKAPI